jgi:hypothetical protein
LESAQLLSINAILAYNGAPKLTAYKTSTKAFYRKRTPTQHANYLAFASNNELNLNIQSDDVQLEFYRFYLNMLALYDMFYPERTITLTSHEPSYVTPELKSMLRRRNTLIITAPIFTEMALACSTRLARMRYCDA